MADIPWDMLARAIAGPNGPWMSAGEINFRAAVNKMVAPKGEGGYGGYRPAARATGIPESTLRRWVKNPEINATPANKQRVVDAIPGIRRRMALSYDRERQIRKGEITLKGKGEFPGTNNRIRKRTLNFAAGNKDAYLRIVNRMVDKFLAGRTSELGDYTDELVDAYADEMVDSDYLDGAYTAAYFG